jgi:hypothetical protein
MKQGTGNSGAGGQKVEPTPHKILPIYTNTMGNMRGNHAMEKGDLPFATVPMDAGAGLKAPMVGQTIHHCGSQGKHK